MYKVGDTIRIKYKTNIYNAKILNVETHANNINSNLYYIEYINCNKLNEWITNDKIINTSIHIDYTISFICLNCQSKSKNHLHVLNNFIVIIYIHYK